MTDTTASPEGAATGGKKPIIVGIIGAIVLGGAGFAVTYLDLLPLGHKTTEGSTVAPMPAVEFVALDPLTITLGPDSAARHLRFGAQLECAPGHAEELRQMAPRVLDVLNSYLRAVELRQLEDPHTLPKLKAQMLRRIQIVTGEGRVTDLLISEFILN
ncbi:flagellar basal body-associated FliL family protein [Pseudotabrizicola sp. L79]|uniref:flagellar basal body-associated FliL family protein n=1 Tax=Pseudotabrizicola sp. L79 TaxID=3118402 RepID=UPI002F926DE0